MKYYSRPHTLYTANRGEQVHSDRVGSVRAEGPESEVCFPWFPMVRASYWFTYQVCWRGIACKKKDREYVSNLDRILSYRKCRIKNDLCMICQDRWEQTKNGDEAVYSLCVWEREMFVGSVAVLSVACRVRPKTWQTFGWTPCTWVEQQLDDGGEKRRRGALEDRAKAVQASSGKGGGGGGGAEKAENSCTDVCLNVVLQS